MEKMISNIVFTKNRPLQLDGYLQGLYRHFPAELIQTYILYKPELFEEEYKQLFSRYPNCVVIREKDFYSDFLKLLSQTSTKYILFGVDDVVYFDSVDFNVIDKAFAKYSGDIFGFSLRFSKNGIEAGHDPIDEITVVSQTVYRINWRNGRTPSTRYPFELCATIYPTALVKKVINSAMNNNLLVRRLFSPSSVLIKAFGKIISTRSVLKSFGYFFNPNTLESWNCRWCQNHSDQLPGLLCFQKLCASAIQVNAVNISTDNQFDNSGGYTVEALADKYRKGHRLDIEAIEKNRPERTHVGGEYFKLINKVESSRCC